MNIKQIVGLKELYIEEYGFTVLKCQGVTEKVKFFFSSGFEGLKSGTSLGTLDTLKLISQ